MNSRWRADLIIFTACLAGLAIGAILWFTGLRGPAHGSWMAAAVLVAVPLVWRTAVALRRGGAGVDWLALAAIVGALVLGQELTAAVVALMLASGRLLESYAERRAGREMSALLAHAPHTANRQRDGRIETVPIADLLPGDRVLVSHGEVLAVDGALDGVQAVLDESALTGEAVPVTYATGAPLRSGAVNAGDTFALIATAVAADSTFAAIVRLVEGAQQSRAPAVRLADRYALWFVPLALGLAAITWIATRDPMRALAVVVVATPCPLLLAVPVAIVSGISRCARRGVLVKSGGALETLTRVTTLFFDKTGTLTRGHARLTAIEPVAGVGADALLLDAASLEQMSNHVIATTIVAAARERGLPLEPATGVREQAGSGLRGQLRGREVAAGSRDYIERITSLPAAVGTSLDRAMTDGTSVVLVAVDGRYQGMLLLADQLRVETPRALRLLRRAGVRRIVMLTGDRREVAEAIGAGLGVDEVLAEQTPAGKLAVIEAARRDGATAMVGDGVNDAPALAAADVGVAIGARGATAAAEAADIVLLADRLDRLAEALDIARRTRTIALQSVFVGMGLSVIAMAAAAAGYLAPLYGAVLQQLIDAAAIGNALRVLRVRTLRASRFTLGAGQSERLHEEHAALLPVLDDLSAVAERLPLLQDAELEVVLRGLDARLRQELLPHERADDEQLYPELAVLLGGDDPMAAMSRTHREIFRLHRRFAGLVARLPEHASDPDTLRELQRTLNALDAILRLHFAQEEEIYQSLARD